MGCWTLYITRHSDGSHGYRGAKWARLEFGSPRALLKHIDTKPVQPLCSDTDLGGFCRGWYADRGSRVARLFTCGESPVDRFRRDEALRSSKAWRDWDVALAWEGRDELDVRSGRAGSSHRLPELDGWAGVAAAGLVTAHPDPHRFPCRWDPIHRRLLHAGYWCQGVDITLVDAKGSGLDFGFEDSEALLGALGRGPALIAELSDAVPCPSLTPDEDGAAIDMRDRTVRIRSDRPIPMAVWSELRRRWAGWTVERERAGLAGVLQRTGRADEIARHGTWAALDLPYPDLRPPATQFPEIVLVNRDEVAPPPPTDEERRLLDAIHADLDDDAPRLAYADYLSARGNGRGELIRVQCDIEARRARGKAIPQSLADHATRVGRAYGRAYIFGGSVLRFRRGFPFHASVYRSRDIGPALTAHPTLRSLETACEDIDAARELVLALAGSALLELAVRVSPGAAPELVHLAAAHLTRLELRGGKLAFEELSLALEPGQLRRIEELRWMGESSSEGFALLLGQDALTDLHRFLVDGPGRGGDAIANVISQSPRTANLRVLALRTVGLTDAGATALARPPADIASRPSEWDLDLAGNHQLSAEGVLALVGQTSRPIGQLTLDGCPLRDDGVTALATHPAIAQIRGLSIARCGVGAAGLLALTRSAHVGGLERLRVDGAFARTEIGTALHERFGARLTFA